MLLLAALLAACRRDPAPPPALAVLRIAHESDLLSLDPIEFAEAATQSVLSNVYEPLVTFDRDMALRPALAVNWTSEDDRSWQITLRPGVLFHDGTPLTADDVRLALERARDSERSAVKNHLAGVREITVTSDHGLRLVSAAADPLLVNRLTSILITRSTPVGLRGTGPYRPEPWQKGQPLAVTSFDGYWGPRPPLPRVEFVTITDGEAALQSLARGQVHLLRWLPATAMERAKQDKGIRVVSYPALMTHFLWINGRLDPALADARVRRAISLALDRNAIVARLVGGGVPTHQMVPEGVFGFVPGLPALPHDPARARALLAEAGHGSGLDLVITHRADETVRSGATAIQQMLGAIGIRSRLESPPWEDVLRGWREGKVAFWYAGWRFASGDAHTFFVDGVATRDASRGRGIINPGFSNPRLDGLIDRAGAASGRERLARLGEVSRLALEEMPHVPVYTQVNLFAVSAHLLWKPRLDGRLLAAEVSPVQAPAGQ